MKTMTTAKFKPKPEYFDKFLDALKLNAQNSYILTRDENVLEIWLKNSIDELAKQQPGAFDWLDRQVYMLEEYSPEERHNRPFTAFVEREPLISKGTINLMRSILITLVLIATIFSFSKTSYAETTYYACKEPQKIKARYVSIDWSSQKIGLDKKGLVDADKWSRHSISWAHNAIQQSDVIIKSEPRMSLFFDLTSETLLLTILDSETIMPETSEDWAKFLPAYFQCKEFF